MSASQWRLQDAKTQFSQVVEAALRGEPQHITRRGRQAVVVLSEQAFEALQQSARAAAPGGCTPAGYAVLSGWRSVRKDTDRINRISED